MTRPNVTLPDECAEPMFCTEPDDFALMVFQIIRSTYAAADENPDEYLACVLSELFSPYGFDHEFQEREKEDFRKVIFEAKAEAIKAGIPMIEKDGKYSLDVKELTKRARLERDKDE